MTEYEEAFLDLNETKLSYRRYFGNRPTIFGLHGLGSSIDRERRGCFDLSPLTDSDRDVVLYDARGHGQSTGSKGGENYTWEILAEDFLALVDKISPKDPVDAFGTSMGTGTILSAVVKKPHRFRRLALLIPPTAWETRAARSDLYLSEAHMVEESGYAKLIEARSQFPPHPLIEAGGWERPIEAPDVPEELFCSIMSGAAASNFPDRDVVAQITHQILIMPWLDDEGHPVSTAEELHRLIPNSSLVVMDTVESIADIGERLLDFFS